MAKDCALIGLGMVNFNVLGVKKRCGISPRGRN